MEEIQLGHGCVESQQSHTDVLAENVMAEAPALSFDVRSNYIYPHDNQRSNGICTQAEAADILYQEYNVEVSELAGYKGQKQTYDGNLLEGSSIKSALAYDASFGVPKKSLVPDDDTHLPYAQYIQGYISQEAHADAPNQKLPGYFKLTDISLNGLVQAGAKSKYGIIIMIRNNNNWYTDINGNVSWLAKDISPLRSGKPYTGAHATKIVRLTMNGDGTIRNTWGDSKNPIYANGTGVWCNDGDIEFNYETIKDDIVEAWGVVGEPIINVWTHTFNQLISYKQQDTLKNTEVTSLQRALVKLGFLVMPKNVSFGYYGDLTRTSVFNYQVNRQVAPLTELNALQGKTVGPATRAQLNKDLNG